MTEDEIVIDKFLEPAPPEAAEEGKSQAVSILDAPAHLPGAAKKAAGAVKMPKVEVIPAEATEKKITDAKNKGGFADAITGQKKAEKVLGAFTPDISDFPIPTGGIALLVFIALLMVFAINPSNPKDPKSPTRLHLLWGATLGNYVLDGGSGGASQAASISQPAPVQHMSFIQGVY